MRPSDQLISKLQGVRQERDGEWWAFCPIHEADGGHHDPSLHITESSDGKLLMFCQVCKEDATAPKIVHALGMTMSELYPDHGTKSGRREKRRPRGRKTAEYEYRDEDGAMLFVVRRYEKDGKKDFFQCRPNGRGGWILNIRNVRRVIYRLPELIANTGTVFVVEGEKKVEALREWGLIATCNMGGAGKWLKEYNKFFAGREVVILPDNDAIDPVTGKCPGRDHARKVLENLQGVAKSVHVLELPGLPVKGDVVDWIAAGHGLAELLELVRKVQSEPQAVTEEVAGEKKPALSDEVISNAMEGGDEMLPLCMEQIRDRIKRATGDWPRRVGGNLFVHDTTHGLDEPVYWVNSTSALFGFFGAKTSQSPRIHKKTGYHTKEEIHAELQRSATAYNAVESYPHEPPIEGHYYACTTPEPGNGEALMELVSKFNPATPHDGDLIVAMFATLFWGGPGGTRPAFVITSDDGRGAGKTKLASMAARLVGNYIEIGGREDIEAIKTRLLSADGMGKRMALLDNVKSLKFSWAELEALITSQVISGHKMYTGEGARPNTLTWCITLNGVSLSTDMAQRSVVVKIRRPKHSGDWETETSDFVFKNRLAIIADIIGFLRQEPYQLQTFSRWGLWERGVLSRFPDCEELQKLIVERQKTSNVEEEEAGFIEDYFSQKIDELDYYSEEQRVFLPNGICCTWVNAAMNERMTTTGATRLLKQKIGEGTIRRIHVCGRTWGRGFVWTPDKFRTDESIQTDIELRIEKNAKKPF